MKKTIALLLCCAMLLLSLASCNAKEELPTDVSETETETETEEATQKETNKKTLSYKDSMITASLSSGASLRDPFVLLHEGKYYVYGTGWTVSVHSSNKLTSSLTNTKECVTRPSDYSDCAWAPEVFLYNGKFYMFTTYKSSRNAHRGCAIFVSDKPDGPFTLHSNGLLDTNGETITSNVYSYSLGHVTPHDWDAIDGTLYIDKEGQPWMIFVHEWTSTDDGVGRMACAKLSEDLTHFISEPIELFRADDATWARGNITDGCFMYETEDGQLLMLWSNHDSSGYSVGIARSESGLVTGPWTHDSIMLYSKKYTNVYDGGHGMIFTDTKGYMWMAIHSPNAIVGNRVETPTYIPIKEQNGTLVWDRLERDLR